LLTSSLCLQLALHLSACEHALKAADSQYHLLEPLRRLEEYARVGVEGYVGKKTLDGITVFVGPALDWQLNGKLYFLIEGRF
jgi:hypothetical protein